MLDDELLALLCCPETHQRLSLGDPASVAELNQAIEAGLVRNRSGELVSEPVQTVLVREDGARLYLVRDDIPVMLVEEAVDLPLE
jgi:uncharacterized protein YbaR (Trm112 family)